MWNEQMPLDKKFLSKLFISSSESFHNFLHHLNFKGTLRKLLSEVTILFAKNEHSDFIFESYNFLKRKLEARVKGHESRLYLKIV